MPSTIEVADLPPSQRRVLDYMRRYMAERRMPPTVREVAAALGVSPNAITGHLAALVRKGLVEIIGDNKSRNRVPVADAGRCPHCGRPMEVES